MVVQLQDIVGDNMNISILDQVLRPGLVDKDKQPMLMDIKDLRNEKETIQAG